MSTRILVSILFLLSGATSLVYQVTWVRNLSLVFGASHEAISVVLAAFMAGLALGGFALGRWSDRLRCPLRAYAWLELGIAVSAVALPWLLGLVEHLYIHLARNMDGVTAGIKASRALFAFLLLLVPTFFMGGTLPVLVRFAVRHLDEFSVRLAWFYGINTGGAVLGVLCAGFLLLPRWGVWRTQLIAVAVNLLVVAVALIVDRATAARSPSQQVAAGRSIKAFDAAAPVRPTSILALRLAFVGTFVCGFSSLALEVMWTRALGISLGTTTYSFTIMLAAFLMGIMLGSAVYSLLRLPRLPEPAQFGAVLVLIGISGTLVSQSIPQLPQLGVALNMRWYGGQLGVNFATTLLLSFLVMLVPAFFFGLAFPIAGRAGLRLRRMVGKSVGDLVGINTLGGIAGPILAGFVLIPHLGMQKSMLLVCGLLIVYGVIVLLAWIAVTRPTLRHAALLPGLIVTTVVLWLPWRLPAWDLNVMGVFQNNLMDSYVTADGRVDVSAAVNSGEVLYYEEGRSATISVAESGAYRAVIINGKSVATDYGTDLEHEYLLGHLPVLLHPDPRSALVIGLGAGLTLGGVTAHDGLQSICLVEIEPAVAGAARVFEDMNGRAMEDPRVDLVFRDGRNFLRTATRGYDVITADPIHPWAYGATYLYTTEYYQSIRDHLNPGGIACQWMPIYELSLENLRCIAATFAENFEHCSLWQTTFDALLIGSDQPLQIDLVDLDRRMQSAKVKQQLGRVGLDSPLAFLAEFTMDDATLRQFAQGAIINSDDNLYLEFSSPLSIGRVDEENNIERIDSARLHAESIISNWPDGSGDRQERHHRLQMYLEAKKTTVAARTRLESRAFDRSGIGLKDVIEPLTQLRDSLPDYGRASTILAEALILEAGYQAGSGDIDQAKELLERAVTCSPWQRHADFQLGLLLLQDRRAEAALGHWDRVAEVRPAYPRLHVLRGMALAQLNRSTEATFAFTRAVHHEPHRAEAHIQLANALTSRGALERAASALRQARKLDSKAPGLHFGLAHLAEKKKQYRVAIQTVHRGLKKWPQDESLHLKLAWLLSTVPVDDLRDGHEALRLLQRLEEVGSVTSFEAQYTLAAALAEIGRFDQAIEVVETTRAEIIADGETLSHRLQDALEAYRERKPLRI